MKILNRNYLLTNQLSVKKLDCLTSEDYSYDAFMVFFYIMEFIFSFIF